MSIKKLGLLAVIGVFGVSGLAVADDYREVEEKIFKKVSVEKDLKLESDADADPYQTSPDLLELSKKEVEKILEEKGMEIQKAGSFTRPIYYSEYTTMEAEPGSRPNIVAIVKTYSGTTETFPNGPVLTSNKEVLDGKKLKVFKDREKKKWVGLYGGEDLIEYSGNKPLKDSVLSSVQADAKKI